MSALARRIKGWRAWWWAGHDAKVAALAAGLSAASGDDAEVLAAELIDEVGRHPRRTDAIEALAQSWDRLSADAREAALCAGGARWAAAARSLLGEHDESRRRAGARIVALIGLAECAAELPPLLNERGGPGDAAEDALAALAARLARGEDDLRTPERAAVAGALQQAVMTADRHTPTRPRVLMLPALLAHGRAPHTGWVSALVRPWLREADHPVHLLMRNVLRRTNDARLDLLAWAWLAREPLASACADRLLAAADAASLTPALHAWHLWASPRRALHLAKRLTARPERRDRAPLAPPAPGAPHDARLGYARWAARVPHGRRERDAMLGALLSDPDPLVRLCAVREAATLTPPPACVADLCFDADPRVALSAATALLCTARRGAIASADRRRLVALLVRSPHARVRGLARALTPKPSRSAARAAAGIDLHTGGDRACAQRIIEVRRRGVSPGAAGALAAFIREEGPTPAHARSTATAVIALGDSANDGHDAVLRAAAQSDEARVRASAVEALARRARRTGALRSEPTIELLCAYAHDPHHRVRAGALRSLAAVCAGTGAPEAVTRRALASMLESPRTLDRVSGLWVVERASRRACAWPEVVHAVATLTKTAGSPGELARARRAADRLLRQVRSGWQARAAHVHGAPGTPALQGAPA